MSSKKTVVQKSVLVLMGLLLMAAGVACNAPAQTEETVEVETAVSKTDAPQTAVREPVTRPSKVRQSFNRAGQTDDDPADESDDFYEGDVFDEGVDWFALAADAAGMDDEAMWDALMNGASIAELVTANGGDPAALADSIAAAETAWIDSLVADGDLTAEEAAEWTAELADEAQEFVNDSSWALWKGVDWFTIAAEEIGVDEDALWEAESIAALAQENGVESQTVVDAIAAAEKGWLDELVASDELTAEEAAEWTTELDEEIRLFVEESWEMGDFEEFDGVDWFVVAAEAIGVDEDAIWEAESIAAVAQANEVDAQVVVDAIVVAETAVFTEMVSDGSITQVEADEWIAELAADVEEFVNDDSWAMWEGVDWHAIAQEALGMDEDTMWEALESGQSIAELAAAQGVKIEAITAAITTAETEWLTELVAADELTQEEMDEWTAEISTDIGLFLNEKWDY